MHKLIEIVKKIGKKYSLTEEQVWTALKEGEINE